MLQMGRDRASAGGRRSRCRPRDLRSLAALLHVRAHKLLGVLVQDLVDLVEQVIELRLDLVGALGPCRRRFLDRLILPGRRRPALLLTFCHCHPSPDGRNHPALSNSSIGLDTPSNKLSTMAAVPLSGSIIGTRCRLSLAGLRSNTIESQLAAAMAGANRCRHRPRK